MIASSWIDGFCAAQCGGPAGGGCRWWQGMLGDQQGVGSVCVCCVLSSCQYRVTCGSSVAVQERPELRAHI